MNMVDKKGLKFDLLITGNSENPSVRWDKEPTKLNISNKIDSNISKGKKFWKKIIK